MIAGGVEQTVTGIFVYVRLWMSAWFGKKAAGRRKPGPARR
jgi:hypothetical protein